MNHLVKKHVVKIASSASTGIKGSIPLERGIRVLEVLAWAGATEATACVVKAQKLSALGITAGAVDVKLCTFPASDQQGKAFGGRPADAVAELAAGNALAVNVTTASSSDKDVTVVIRYIEAEELIENISAITIQ